jgi:hypothetical protein
VLVCVLYFVGMRITENRAKAQPAAEK